MGIPFISQPKERDEAVDNFMTEAALKNDTENMYNMSSQKQDKNMADYYEKTQIEIYLDEMKVIDALLKGKELVINDDAKLRYDYPRRTVKKYLFENKDGDKFAVSENDANEDEVLKLMNENKYIHTYNEEEIVKVPFCNEEGQSAIIGFASALIRASTALSNYSIDRVYVMNKLDLESLNVMIYLNNKEWKVDPSRHESVVMTIGDRMDAARRRAVDNKANEAAQTTHTVSHVIQNSDSKPGIPLLGGGGQQKQRGL